MNMHQVTPESIRKLREVLKKNGFQTKELQQEIDSSSDSGILHIAANLIGFYYTCGNQ